MLCALRFRLKRAKGQLLQLAGRVCTRTSAGVPGECDGLRDQIRNLQTAWVCLSASASSTACAMPASSVTEHLALCTGCGGRGPRNSAVRSLLPLSIPTNAADAAWNLPTAPARKRWTLIQHRRFSRLLGIGSYWLARAKPGRETRCAHGDRSMWATAARSGLRCASLAARSRAPRRHLRRR